MVETREYQPGGSGTEMAKDGYATPTWARVLIFGAAALAVLLIGATIGLLIGRSGALDDPAAPTPGPVDVGFAQDMSVHHLQAVTMGNWVRDHSTDPAIRQLGFDIASTQQGQVGTMQGWLTLWEEPEQAVGEPMGWMSTHAGHDAMPSIPATAEGALMPGMATQDELKKLRSLSGKRLDVYFLQLMLRHHMGGVPMAEYAVKNAELPAVRRLAQSMLDSQGAEMTLMRRMLADRGAHPLR
ncbi:MAG: DUF305 domain-containing protein [Haloechinothrix sp.]